MTSGSVVVRTFSTRPEAELAKSALEAAGIQAAIMSDDAGGLRPAMAWANGVALIVRAGDAEAAAEILDGEATRIN